MTSGDRKFSRRDFLKTAGAVGIATAVGAAGVTEMAAAVTTPGAVVPQRPFGASGIPVAILGLGGMFDVPNNQLLLRQALRLGVTYWDTADCYGGGDSEEGMGKFFRRFPQARRRVFLVTKSDARDPKGMERLLARSLERLQTDYVDLYLVHAISNIDALGRGVRSWVESQKRAGRIKLFGFSTHSNMEKCLLGAAELGWIDGIMMTYNFRLMHEARMRAAVAACVRAGIGLTAMKTQGGGPVRTSNPRDLERGGRFLRQGYTAYQAKLKAVWENPHIASICSQMPSLKILQANAAAAMGRQRLSMQEHEALRQYAAATYSTYCAGCTDICEPLLGGEVPVGKIMRSLMYYHQYGDPARARGMFAELGPEIRQRLTAVDYEPAEKSCPRRLAIGRLVQTAAELLA